MNNLEIKHLKWDSDFFQLKIGSVLIPSNFKLDTKSIKLLQKNKGYDLLYLFTHQDNHHQILVDMGACLMDQKVTYTKPIIPISNLSSKAIAYQGELNTELLNLAYESGHESRFNTDPSLQHNFKRLYRSWIYWFNRHSS